MTPAADDDRSAGLLTWQWSGYGRFHRDRTNLALHAITNPMFVLGSAALVVSIPAMSARAAILGVAFMVLALALQGRGHRRERAAPIPFRSGWDLVARFFAEQWITFPRFVLTGGFARAWREAAR